MTNLEELYKKILSPDEIFNLYCISGDIEEAKNLVSQISFSTNGIWYFELACKHNHLDMAKWLWEYIYKRGFINKIMSF